MGLAGLGVETAVAQRVAKEGFEAKHGRFGQAAAVVTALDFPRLGTLLPEVFDHGGAWMGSPIRQRRPRHRAGAGRNQGGYPTVQEGGVAGPGIVGPIGGDRGDRLIGGQWLQQRWQDLRVSEILCVSRVRESVIGSKSFTELDGELRFCRGPREGWMGPLGGQIAQRQPDQFSGGLIVREMPLVADTLAHAAV